MLSSIRKERQKIREEINEFDTLLDYIDRRSYRSPHLVYFQEYLKHCKKALLKDLDSSLDKITEGFSTTEKSSKLRDFRSNLKHLRDLLLKFLLSSEVPRELYWLCDLFLEYNNTRAEYLICMSEEIASLPMSYILMRLGLNETHPSFWNQMKDSDFYFIQVTSNFKEPSSAIDWPIILHEISHVICKEKKIDERYLEPISVYTALRLLDQFSTGLLPPNSPLIDAVTRKLYVTEYLADFFVTKCLAGAFGWRFLEKYVSLVDIFEVDRDRAHPPPDKRLQRMLTDIKRHIKNPAVPQFLEAGLAELMGREGKNVDKRLEKLDVGTIEKDVEPALNEITKMLNTEYKYTLTDDRIKESIQETQWFKLLSKLSSKAAVKKYLSQKRFDAFLRQLSDNFADATPIVADPSTLYYLVMLRYLPSTKSTSAINKTEEEVLSKLIADAIRLYSIQRTFLQ